jgi:hypothetical protein
MAPFACMTAVGSAASTLTPGKALRSFRKVDWGTEQASDAPVPPEWRMQRE